jgi:pimeloyl-ACP methyl ester carboxylesterase
VRKVTLDDVELSYTQHGAGEPVAMVHGSVSDATIWDAHAQALSAGYKVVVPTQRYFGDSRWSDDGGKFSIEQHGKDLVALLERLDLAGAKLVGWSYGGAVSLVAAILRPDLIRALVLYEPALASHVADDDLRRRATDDRAQMTARCSSLLAAGDYYSAVEAFVDDANDRTGTFSGFPERIRASMRGSARTLPLLFRAAAPPIGPENLRKLRPRTIIGYGAQTRSFFRIAVSSAAAESEARAGVRRRSRRQGPPQEAASRL